MPYVYVSFMKKRCRACFEKKQHCSQLLPAVRPQGPTARDSGSSAVQQGHICVRRQPAILQLACHRGNLPKTTDWPSTLTEALNVNKSWI